MGTRRPRKAKAKKQAPVTKHHREAADCPHPANARIGDRCAQCGTQVRGR